MKTEDNVRDSMSIEKMFEGNIENFLEIKEIIMMNTLCIKKLTDNQSTIEQQITELRMLVNKIVGEK